jgi:hypothetical protein
MQIALKSQVNTKHFNIVATVFGCSAINRRAYKWHKEGEVNVVLLLEGTEI